MNRNGGGRPNYGQLAMMALVLLFGLYAVIRVMIDFFNPDPNRGFMGLPRTDQSELKESK